MTNELATVYRRAANRGIEPVEMKVDEAEFVVSRVCSTSADPASFAPWPWPPARPPRGTPTEPDFEAARYDRTSHRLFS